MKKSMIILISIILVIALILIFLISINRLVIVGAGEIIEGNNEESITKKYDAIVVLGASVYSDGTPSNILIDRLLGAVKLYKAGVSDKIIVSGDYNASNHYDEISTMKQYCIDNGVPASDIITDGEGYSTYESMYNIVKKMGIKNIIIATQKYHTFRAVYIARKLGADADGFATNYREYIFIAQKQRDTREFAARVKDFFKVNFSN